MLFYIFVVALAAGIIFVLHDWMYTGGTLIIVGAIGVLISLVVFVVAYFNIRGHMDADKKYYDHLVYQLENDIYDNDNDFGKRELMVDIQEWNIKLAWLKQAQYDFWIGIYIPNTYDHFEYVLLE